MRFLRKAILVVLLAAVAGTVAPAAEKGRWTVTMDSTTASIQLADRPLLTYRFAEVPFKPYLQTLLTPGGLNVLREAPSDHLHHHALMFAIHAGGIDFWSETPACGKQIHAAFDEAAADRAGFAEQLDWVAPKESSPLMREHRAITAFDEPGVSLLAWATSLEAGPGRASVPLTGEHFEGLGMRLPPSMDHVAEFFGADPDAPRDNVRGEEYVFPSRWVAVTGLVDGKPVTVALFDSPGNPRPARWFTMAKDFAYMSATLNLYKEPMTLEAGKPLRLLYGVAAWDGKRRPDEIQKVYERWLELVEAACEKKP